MASKIKIKLPNGQYMPALGFGTWQVCCIKKFSIIISNINYFNDTVLIKIK